MTRRELPVGSMLKPASMAHYVLWTRDIPRLKAWYLKVLGAHVVFESEKIAFLTYDEEHHRLALSAAFELAERPAGRSVGLSHVAFSYRTLGDLLAKYLELKAAGILPFWKVFHGPTVSMYYEDPERNNVELQVDSFPDADSATAYMRSDEFQRNPLGIDFVPEDLIARWEAGEDEQVLLRRPSI